MTNKPTYIIKKSEALLYFSDPQQAGLVFWRSRLKNIFKV